MGFLENILFSKQQPSIADGNGVVCKMHSHFIDYLQNNDGA